MGEIQRAYEILNRTLKLNLTANQLMVAEAAFKLDFGTRMKFPKETMARELDFAADWEVQSTLVPRQVKLRTRTKKTFEALKLEALAGK